MKPTLATLLAGAAIAGFSAGVALADETTVIHEQRQVAYPPSQGTAEQQTTRESDQSAVGATTVRRHVVLRRHAVHHVATHHIAAAARTRSVDAAASEGGAVQNTRVQTDTAVSGQANPSLATVDKRTVIHRDNDTGQTETHTRIIRQDPNGMTSVEHRSTEQTTTP